MSHRSIICQKKVTFDYPDDNIKMEIDRSVYPDDPDEPGESVPVVLYFSRMAMPCSMTSRT